jgi:hypothetical protein
MTVEQEPTNKLLCYYVRHYLVNTIAALEGLQDPETTSANRQKHMELATTQARKALETADRLFKAICFLDPGPMSDTVVNPE